MSIVQTGYQIVKQVFKTSKTSKSKTSKGNWLEAIVRSYFRNISEVTKRSSLQKVSTQIKLETLLKKKTHSRSWEAL